MSYVDMTDKDIMEMDDEVLECEIRSEMNAYLNHRYKDARRDNLIRLFNEQIRRIWQKPKSNYVQGPPPNPYVWG